MKSFYLSVGLLIAGLLMGSAVGIYHGGQSSGKAVCVAAQAQVNEKAEVVQKAATQAVINRATATSTKHEADRVAINNFFNHLARSQNHAPADPIDSCVLPDERLRLWREANAGRPTESATPGQPDSTAPATATPDLGATAGAGNQSPRDGTDLPPARPADVQPALISGDQA